MLGIDNHAVERSSRPIACGRRNYLFTSSEGGDRATATIYSIIETAKLNGHGPFHYLADLLERLPGHKINRFAELLPFNLHEQFGRVSNKASHWLLPPCPAIVKMTSCQANTSHCTRPTKSRT